MSKKLWWRVQIVLIVFYVVRVSAGQTDFSDRGWCTWRFDKARSGVTRQVIGPELYLRWSYEPVHPPEPAWPMPAEEMPRMHSDNAYNVAAAGGKVYFGCGVSGKVCCIDAGSGQIRWEFFTEGPVRFAPTVYGGRVYVGSDDGYVYCLDAGEGRLIWRYLAGPSGEKVIGNGRMISMWPVRTGVLVDKGVVYFGAGVFPYEGIYICAVDAEDGSVIWRNGTIGARAHELRFGGISPHGYLVASEDMLYVPSGRAMPAGFDRRTGRFLFYASPGGKSGGTWALLDDDTLIAGVDITAGQNLDVPHKAAYDARTGELKGEAFGWFRGVDMVLTGGEAYILTQDGIYAINRAVYGEAVAKTNESVKERKRLAKELSALRERLKDSGGKSRAEIQQRIEEITHRISQLIAEEKRLRDSSFRWYYRRKGLCSLIMAGDILFAGGEGLVVGVDAKEGKELWKGEVSGKAVGLAAAEGRLLVSTDQGPIHCFGKEKVSWPRKVAMICNPSPYRRERAAAIYEWAAAEIVKESSIHKGYCLVLDCERGGLAYELAKRTELKIIGIEKDPEKLAAARQRLEAAGLLGVRVVVEPWEIDDLPGYFANLVVSEGMLFSGRSAVSREQIKRVLRPYGGVALLGATKGKEIIWDKFVRGELEGAGSWTQLYGNPQNTCCSGDRLVKGPFGVQWFGEPGPEKMVERHARAAGPVSINGRLFIEGEEVIMAYDAYNGTLLWEREIPGAVRVRVDVDGGNLALTEEALYVAAYDKCHRLDPATGRTLRSYELPSFDGGGKRRWGYVCCVEDVLFGTAAMDLRQGYGARYKAGEPDETVDRAFQRVGTYWHGMADFPRMGSQRSPLGALDNRLLDGDAVFAVDVDTGAPRWVYRGKRIPNISITIAEGSIFFVEGMVSAGQRKAALRQKQELIEKGIYKEGAESKLKPEQADIRVVVCLDAATGKVLWRRPMDLTGCGGNKMGTAYADGLLVFFGHFSNHDTGFFKQGQLSWRRITVVDGKSGEVVWSRALNYLRRPLIVGRKVIIEPRACDLHTGEIITREHPITGEEVPWEFLRPGHSCGVTTASADTLFYRSYQVAIYELSGDKGLSLFGGIRPGCWLNMITANGLMLMPEASCGCTCSFPLRGSVALVNKPRRVAGNWTVFITGGATRPVKHLAINFGAPGDMRDNEGTLWFAYPRPKTVSNIGYGSYEVKFDLQEEEIEGMGPFCRDYKGVEVEGTDKPWLFTCGYLGLLSCKLALIGAGAGQPPGTYTVRLGFNGLAGERPGQRSFDVKMQGDVVLGDFDVVRTAGKGDKAVIKEIRGVVVEDILSLELVPRTPNPQAGQAPIINFMEVIREDRILQ